MLLFLFILHERAVTSTCINCIEHIQTYIYIYIYIVCLWKIIMHFWNWKIWFKECKLDYIWLILRSHSLLLLKFQEGNFNYQMLTIANIFYAISSRMLLGAGHWASRPRESIECSESCLFVWVLEHTNLCKLFNAKSIFIQINSSTSNNSV